MKIINYIIACLRLIIAMTAMLMYYIWYRLRKPFATQPLEWGLEVQKNYARLALRIFGTQHSMTGQAYHAPALYVSNHRSLLDPVIIRSHIKALGVAKAEVEHYPILGKAVSGTGIIFVQREDRTSRREAKNAIVQHLEKGHSVLLFPEGTVSGETTTLPFRKGSFEKAVEANVPVVPITLIYNDPKYHWYNMSTMTYYFNSFGWNTPNVKMIVGPPIFPSTVEQVMEEARDQINKQLLSHNN